jgi:DNA-binding NtrC family response regulator
LQDMLGREGHRVAIALSGVEALGLVEKDRFDLIFLDLVMPGLDGSEVFKRIRKIDEHVPVAIITGHPDSELLAKAMEQGPFIVMKKPLDIYEIRKTVYSLTNSGNGGK